MLYNARTLIGGIGFLRGPNGRVYKMVTVQDVPDVKVRVNKGAIAALNSMDADLRKKAAK